mmetsp:Transcript_106134/g.317020  ORF Transcript_106134/g.317020 Transcript_106134/m.317020 type:complete len:97 (-) Transcript_106134:260-550(-)
MTVSLSSLSLLLARLDLPKQPIPSDRVRPRALALPLLEWVLLLEPGEGNTWLVCSSALRSESRDRDLGNLVQVKASKTRLHFVPVFRGEECDGARL